MEKETPYLVFLSDVLVAKALGEIKRGSNARVKYAKRFCLSSGKMFLPLRRYFSLRLSALKTFFFQAEIPISVV
jgi:hypothetical protein